MKLFLIAFGLEGIVSFLLKGKVDTELFAIIYMMINSVLLISWFWFKSRDKSIFIILLCGFLLRLVALFYDRSIALLPFNTMDGNAFHYLGVETANALPYVLLEHYTGFYSQVLGIVYYIFGPYRFWGQFLNISLIMLAATKIIDIGNLLNIKLKNIKLMTFLWVMMPIPFLNGNAMLREATIYYFIVLSIYFFIKWFEQYNIVYYILSVLAIYIASLYHGGVLVLVAPYIYTFLFYNRKKKTISMNFTNIIFLVVVLFVCYALVSENSEILFNKVNMDTGGGSAYLTGMEIDSPLEFMLFGPIKAFYLLFSPMPWLIRGFFDIITFLFDTSIWIIGAIYILKNYKKINIKIKIFFISIIIGGIIFGMGTLNTGTAIRHRNKLLPFLIISVMYTKNENEKKITLDKSTVK